jgi:selenide,water dikinase
MDRPDDAGVFLVRPDLALVQTVDLITPIADDPADFGRVTAANAMSDVWAMGGTPLTALSIVAFPVASEPPDTFRGMLRGALAAFAEAGVALVGGHSVDDPELKLGFAVTGTVDPSRMLLKGGAAPGDAIVLTKAIGTGVVSTALKRGRASGDAWAAALAGMTALNRDASRVAVEAGLRCATDVTGFGLLGHLHEVSIASGVSATLDVASIPLLPGAREYAAEGLSPGGTERNLAHVRSTVDGLDGLDAADVAILCDPQTSGGLLLAVPPPALDGVLAGLAGRGAAGRVVGRFTVASDRPRIRVG